MIRNGLLADLIPVAQTDSGFAVIGSLLVEPLPAQRVPIKYQVNEVVTGFYGEGEPDGYKRLREALR